MALTVPLSELEFICNADDWIIFEFLPTLSRLLLATLLNNNFRVRNDARTRYVKLCTPSVPLYVLTLDDSSLNVD
jgi:hypothetical protein